MSKQAIKVAIVGVGNCASAIYQGLTYYKDFTGDKIPGVMFADIGGYQIKDIEVVAAFDVDKRKIGLPIGQAIFQEPNCARVFAKDVPDGPVVQMGEVLDGISDYMETEREDRGFRVADKPAVDVVKALKDSGAQILINYLPVGSQKATEFYMQAAIDAGVAVVNCIPVFIASDPKWEQKFIDAKLPIIGDDMRSQVGASVLSQMLQELAFDRGAEVDFHQQINIGGNTDFNNMMVQTRLESKKKSKENVIRAQNDIRDIPLPKDSLFAGPSTFIPYLEDNKVAYLNVRLRGFGDAPVTIDAKLSVQDSENSAGVVVDAIRYLQVAREMGMIGTINGPSAFTQKSPKYQMKFKDAMAECEAIAQRNLTEVTKRENMFDKQVSETKKAAPEKELQLI
jgi:myo-inositol-1-phosphate synthase